MGASGRMTVWVSSDGMTVKLTSAYINSAVHWQTFVGGLMTLPLILALATGTFHFAMMILALLGVVLSIGRLTMHGKRDVVEGSPSGIRYGLADPSGRVASWGRKWAISEIREVRVNNAGTAIRITDDENKSMSIPLGPSKAEVEYGVALVATVLRGQAVAAA